MREHRYRQFFVCYCQPLVKRRLDFLTIAKEPLQFSNCLFNFQSTFFTPQENGAVFRPLFLTVLRLFSQSNYFRSEVGTVYLRSSRESSSPSPPILVGKIWLKHWL